MSATAATPDHAATAPPVNSPASAEDELEQYYADIEARGDLEHDSGGDGGGGGGTPPVAPPAAPALPAAAAATTPPADATAAPAVAPLATPPAARTDEEWWNEIDNDSELPRSLQGKTRREVYAANKKSRWEAMQANQQRNDSVRELEVTRGLLKTFQTAQPAPATVAPPAPRPGHEVFGLPDRESAFGAVDRVVDQLPQLIEQRATEIADQRVAPLARSVDQLQREREIEHAESARLAVRDHLKLAPDVYERMTPALKAHLLLNNLDPRYPQNWEVAVMDYRATAARLVPQTSAPPTSAPPAGSATSAAAAPPAAAARRPISTGDKRQDTMLGDQLVDFYGYERGSQKFNDMFAKTVTNIRNSRRIGDDE